MFELELDKFCLNQVNITKFYYWIQKNRMQYDFKKNGDKSVSQTLRNLKYEINNRYFINALTQK